MSDIQNARQAVLVRLAGKNFPVTQVSTARIGDIRVFMMGTFTNIVKGIQQGGLAVVFSILTDKVFECPYELLSLFIEDLPKEIFEDRKDGVTFPEFLDALDICLKVNRLEGVWNFLMGSLLNRVRNQE